MKTLLFVTTEPSLTGAPLYLLNHIRHLKTVYSYNFIVIFIHKKGSLTDEYRKVSTVYFWEDVLSCGLNLNPLLKRVLNKAIIKSGILSYNLFKIFFFLHLKSKNIILIISNSSTIEKKALLYLKKTIPVPIIMIVHEGEKLLQQFNRDGTIESNIAISDRLIAVSEYLKEVLIDRFKITKEITVISGAIANRTHTPIPDMLLNDLNIPQNAKVVMSSGWLSWHKGADFFIQTAIQVLKTHNDVHFCWLGDAATDEVFEQFNFDIEKAGINHNVHHIPSNPQPLNYFNRADIFLTLSRDESFSLVTIEACSLKKPVLCFEKTGGPCEILGQGSNLIIPYGNIDLLSRKIVELLENDELRLKIGELLNYRVESNYTIEKTSLQLQEVLNSTSKNHKH